MDWMCPHCGSMQSSTTANFSLQTSSHDVGSFKEHPWNLNSDHGTPANNALAQLVTSKPILNSTVHILRCVNPTCSRISAKLFLNSASSTGGRVSSLTGAYPPIFYGQVYPVRKGRVFDSCVPDFLQQDYQEASAIAEISPRASATLARRCLQGMIQDFCGIKKRTLFDEIEALKVAVEVGSAPAGVNADIIPSFEAVRKFGNIGAHMSEQDGVIVDVEPEEVNLMLELIELLFDEWYVSRARRAKTLENLTAAAQRLNPKSQ